MNLTEHPSWLIRDSTKLDTYYDCPRKYFYEYILGWCQDVPAHDLHFGESWHHAREYMLLNGYDDIAGAYSAFINHYRLVFPEESDTIYRPKDPFAVGMALRKFATERKADLALNKVLFTETSGKVPVDNTRYLYYRMDSVMERKEDGMIFSWDHKSATERSLNWTNRTGMGWDTKFYLAIQNFTYTHCLYCMYPVERVLGVEFCGTGFGYVSRGPNLGYRILFKRVPVFSSPDQMNDGLWQVIEIMNRLDRDMDRLYSSKESDPVFMSFPKNPNACTKYYGCAFHDFCLSWSNPLQRCQEPPLGFKVEHWDPSTMKTTNKKDLEWQR